MRWNTRRNPLTQVFVFFVDFRVFRGRTGCSLWLNGSAQGMSKMRLSGVQNGDGQLKVENQNENEKTK